ncbi:hypothetical protein PSTG_14620 [Puccinia striiformis f. sp. tritici PST-78]|uniref:Uncharacterized protein n=1 Tax=Puccinia striiformis f. sp. tritici PST-78 TaxID=1165861 RepID=A0A0L0UYX9_9BASI|nr:hypothetical protein PSTG_14620 [Puccinia striiformis f. sp. tritici PST-78]
MLSGNDLPTRRQSIKKLERSNTLLGRAKSFGASGYEEFCINYQTELIHTWFNSQHLDKQSSRASADGIQIPKMDSQDHSPAQIEMLRGGLMGGKADSKPGGIIDGLGKTSNSHRKGKYSTLEEAASDVLDGMHSHFASHPSFISRPSHSTSQSVFGIKHWLGPVSYEASGIIQADLVWNVLNIKPNKELYANDWDPVWVRHQLNALRVPELIVRKKVDYPFDFDLTMFSMRFRLEGTEANDLRQQLSIGMMLEENQDFVIGSQQQPIAGHLAGFDIPGGSPQELDSWGDLGGGGSGSYSHLIPSGSGNGDDQPNLGYEAERNIPQSPGFGGEGQLHDAPHRGPTGYHDGPAQSRVWGSEWESKQPMEEQDMLSKEERYMDVGMIKHNQLGGKIEGNTKRDGATNAVLLKTNQNQTLEEVESSKAGLWWVVIVWALTFYIPNFLLSTIERMKRPDIQMAWREKVALCLIIFLMCGSVLFVILGLGKITCPNLAKAWAPNELGFHATERDFYIEVRGQVFDLAKFWRGQHSDITVSLSQRSSGYGSGQVVKASALGNDKWYTEKFLPFMTNFHKGPNVYTRNFIAGLADNRAVGIYNGGVYDLSDYFYTYNTQYRNPQFQCIDKSITDLFQQQPVEYAYT